MDKGHGDHKERLKQLNPVWNEATYIPTGAPFNYETTSVDASALAEEISRMTGITGETVHTAVICGWELVEHVYRDGLLFFRMAQDIAFLTGIDEAKAYLILSAEDYIYWKNGINYEN